MTENTKAMYGGFFRRLIAYFIDNMILLVVGVALLGIYFAVAGDFSSLEQTEVESATNTFDLIVNIVGFIMGLFYWAVMESSSRQATVGKIVMRLAVTDYQGQRITFARGVGRYFGRLLGIIILFLGFLMALVTRRKQTLHDILTKTLVVKKDAMAEMTFDPPQ